MMISRDEAKVQIDATLRSRGFVEDGSVVPAYRGTVSVHGKPVDIRIEVPDYRFVQRPRVFLIDKEQVDVTVLAHVEIGEGICYAPSSGYPFDFTNPGGAILLVLDEVKRTLELSFAGNWSAEVADEYQQYWMPGPGASAVSLMSKPPGNGTKSVSIEQGKKNEKYRTYIVEERKPVEFELSSTTPGFMIYTEGRIGVAGDRIGVPEDMPDLEDWWSRQSCLSDIPWQDFKREMLQDRICFVWARNAFVGFRVIVPSDIRVGIVQNKIRRKKIAPLLETRWPLLGLQRWVGRDGSLDWITQRNGGGRKGLNDFKIALVGCGTIGSHLAKMLVQSGAGSEHPLLLFDTDRLTEGNLGRHLLGFDDLYKNKADAVGAELTRFHPFVDVESFAQDALSAFDILAACDLVIDATGDWNVQNALNAAFLEASDEKLSAVLHCYVFTNGVSAQTYLHIRDGKACFRCLRPDIEKGWRYPGVRNDADIQTVAASCGDGTFIPFTVDSSAVAASLANRAAVDWANGECHPRLRTLVLDNNKGRYQKPVSPDRSPHCPVCEAV